VIGCGHVSGLLLQRLIQPRAGMAMREPKADQQIELVGSCTKTALSGPDLSDHFPLLFIDLLTKNLFVAVVTIIPVWIVADLIALDSTRFVLMASLLLYIVGRELLMDVQDMEGDGSTLANFLGDKRSVTAAFGLQAMALACLGPIVRSSLQAASLAVMLAALVSFALMWKKKTLRILVIHSMKLQIAFAYAFLVS
jgi:4-hydroxybenzoate polyprenyltransferase